MTNKTLLFFLFSLVWILFFTSCTTVKEQGRASYYADKFEGRKTSSGTMFKQRKLTAAHRTLPFGTKLKVINLDNGRAVHVKVTDRGPFVQGRMIDLSKKAAKKLGMLQQGVANVEIKYKRRNS
jgi:rare lipoprotein A